MELSIANVLELWEMFCETLPAAKRNDMAVRFLRLFIENDIELSDLEELRGEDEHLDHAFDQLSDLLEDYDDETEYDD